VPRGCRSPDSIRFAIDTRRYSQRFCISRSISAARAAALAALSWVFTIDMMCPGWGLVNSFVHESLIAQQAAENRSGGTFFAASRYEPDARKDASPPGVVANRTARDFRFSSRFAAESKFRTFVLTSRILFLLLPHDFSHSVDFVWFSAGSGAVR